jgi:hypothetical protein
LTNFSEAYTIFAILYVLVIFGTVWGVTRVLFPLFKITWTALRITVLTLLIIMPLFTGHWFRLFGYNAFDILWAPMPSASKAELRRFRENNHTLNGVWVKDWREKQGIEPLPADWDGDSYHEYPAIVSLLVPLMIFGFYAGVNLLHNMGKDGEQKWRRIPRPTLAKHRSVPTMDELNADLAEIFAEPIPGGWYPRLPHKEPSIQDQMRDAVKRKIAATQKDDKGFVLALRGLGYKAADIKAISEQCTEPDLEGRVRHALKLLSRK